MSLHEITAVEWVAGTTVVPLHRTPLGWTTGPVPAAAADSHVVVDAVAVETGAPAQVQLDVGKVPGSGSVFLDLMLDIDA